MNAFGRHTKFTWRSSGVTYLTRDPNAWVPYSLRDALGVSLCTRPITFIIRWTSEKLNLFLIWTSIIIKWMYVIVSEDHMLDWHSCQICYTLEIKLLLVSMGPVQFTWRPWSVTLYATHYVHNSMNLWKMKFISYVNVSCPCEVVSKRRRE